MSDVDVSVVARLIAEPTRAVMLTALLDGRALTAGELARVAGVGAPTASEHLSRMLDGGLLSMVGQGRHRYFRLAGPEVAQLLESLAVISPPWFAERGVDVGAARQQRRPLLRGCMDWTERREHLAGALPAAFATVCLEREWVRRRAAGERGLNITDAGRVALGLD